VEIVQGRERRMAYLPTSPEIHMKKALGLGWTDIFELKNCFRKGEFSPHHENEFIMLEWYRGFAGLEMILEDLQALLVELEIPQPRHLTMAQLFAEILGFNLQPATSAGELRELCARLGVHFLEEDSFNDLFHRLLIDRIEPRSRPWVP
jgi:lysyl-tRNA synthetase class 2